MTPDTLPPLPELMKPTKGQAGIWTRLTGPRDPDRGHWYSPKEVERLLRDYGAQCAAEAWEQGFQAGDAWRREVTRFWDAHECDERFVSPTEPQNPYATCSLKETP